MSEVRQGILVVIDVSQVFADGIALRRKRGDAHCLAGISLRPLKQGGQRKCLAAINPDFKKALGPEFRKQKKPHDVKRIFPKPTALAAEILAMSPEFRGKTC